MIDKVKITNFKTFSGTFEIKLNQGLNILVGNNEAGKSTILEAIHIALTGFYGGRNIRNEISQYLFNKKVVSEYLKKINEGGNIKPPKLTIEVFSQTQLMQCLREVITRKRLRARG